MASIQDAGVPATTQFISAALAELAPPTLEKVKQLEADRKMWDAAHEKYQASLSAAGDRSKAKHLELLELKEKLKAAPSDKALALQVVKAQEALEIAYSQWTRAQAEDNRLAANSRAAKAAPTVTVAPIKVTLTRKGFPPGEKMITRFFGDIVSGDRVFNLDEDRCVFENQSAELLYTVKDGKEVVLEVKVDIAVTVGEGKAAKDTLHEFKGTMPKKPKTLTFNLVPVTP